MLATASALRSAQVGRAVTLPERAAATPVRTAILEGLQQRNAMLDALFYDVKVVTQEEARAIAPWLAGEGAILIVPPPGEGALTLCPRIEDFVAHGGAEIGALAVAGVGSSALGSAAFARNVAASTGEKVAAVVSGYGLADLATEALGGYFWFGGLNAIRHSFEPLDEALAPRPASPSVPPASDQDLLTRSSLDTRTVLGLLEREDLGFKLLVGHSKGNLVLSEALYALRRRSAKAAKALGANAKVVTVSARIAMPPVFENVVDVMGEWDWFGGLNSRRDIDPDIEIKRAWHHTNTDLWAHLGVTEAMNQALAK